MTWGHNASSTVSRFLRWIATPFRVFARAMMVLVDLSPRQMQALCTLSMIGGIMANSFWIWIYVNKVERAALLGLDPSSPLFTVTLSVVKYLAIMSGCFALFMCLVAFGADWIRVKYKNFEAGTGKKEAAEAARLVADAADDVADDIEESVAEPADAGKEIN